MQQRNRYFPHEKYATPTQGTSEFEVAMQLSTCLAVGILLGGLDASRSGASRQKPSAAVTSGCSQKGFNRCLTRWGTLGGRVRVA